MANEICAFAELNIWACPLQTVGKSNELQTKSRKTNL